MGMLEGLVGDVPSQPSGVFALQGLMPLDGILTISWDDVETCDQSESMGGDHT
ncbi:hypothetical protein [Actinomyces provencensis]|uniref:hypothetical protein n=1 Tax=Actinomyces provencensis TaxID=1720198 RepID=UPI0012B6016E|nr:hypothetical protein [Actinomyces provencensis]